MAPGKITRLGSDRSGMVRPPPGAAALTIAGRRGGVGASTAGSAGAVDLRDLAGGAVIRHSHGGEVIGAGMIMAVTDGGMGTAATGPIPALIFTTIGILLAHSGEMINAGGLPAIVLTLPTAKATMAGPVATGELTIRGLANSQPDNGGGCKMFPAALGIQPAPGSGLRRDSSGIMALVLEMLTGRMSVRTNLSTRRSLPV